MYIFFKGVELVQGGSVINGANPSSSYKETLINYYSKQKTIPLPYVFRDDVFISRRPDAYQACYYAFA